MNKPLIMIGSGGHATVLMDILRKQSREVIAVFSPDKPKSNLFDGIPVFPKDASLSDYSPMDVLLVNGIGSLPRDYRRQQLYSDLTKKGYMFETVVSPDSYVSEHSTLQQGVQIMTGSIIQAGATIGENTIVNTAAQIDHDCVIGSSNYISPGAILCGGVETGTSVHIGAGSTIIQSAGIASDTIIGLGSLITRSIGKKSIHYPARGRLDSLD